MYQEGQEILEGRFKIIKKLGSGAFGEIFKGKQASSGTLNHPVAPSLWPRSASLVHTQLPLGCLTHLAVRSQSQKSTNLQQGQDFYSQKEWCTLTYTYSHLSLFLLLLIRSWEEKDRRLLCCQNCKCKTTSLACYLAKVQIYCFWRRLWVQSVLNFFNFAPLYRLPGQPPSIFALVSDERVPIQILAAPILIGCWKALWKPTLRTRTSGLVRSRG